VLSPNEAFILTDSARRILKKPLGMLVRGDPDYVAKRIREIISRMKPRKIVTVGDYVTYNCIRHGIIPDVAVINGKTKRKQYSINLDEFFSKKIQVGNPPGTITWESYRSIEESLKEEKVLIKVKGEEDLLGIPAIILAPYGSLIIYGQPDEGAVIVTVSKEEKNKILNIVRLMERRRLNERE